MKNRAMTLAGALLLVAVLGKFYVPPLLAQARAALVKNVDEPGRSPYQALPVSANDCGTYTFLNFPAVPAGKRLVITFASGAVFTPESSPANTRLWSSNGPINSCPGTTSGPFAFLPISDKIGATDTYFSGQIQFYVEEGHTPVLQDSTGLNLSGRVQNFAIVGYLIDKTN